jgi:hypothetical protein
VPEGATPPDAFDVLLLGLAALNACLDACLDSPGGAGCDHFNEC